MKAIQEELAIARVKGKSGSSVKTAVIKATRSDGMAPKRKHVVFLVQATKGTKPHSYPILSACRSRLSLKDWQVAVKSLTLIHWLLNEAGDQFRAAACRSNISEQGGFSDPEAPGFSGLVRSYSQYITRRLLVVSKLGERDFVELLGPHEDDVIDSMDIADLLDFLSYYSPSLQLILDLKPHFSLLTNQICVAAFSIVLKDCVKIYKTLNKCFLRVTDEYKTMSRKEAQAALKLYEDFIAMSDELIDDFFPACKRFTKKLPKFRKLPDSILDTLEDYVKVAPKKAPKRAERKRPDKKDGKKSKKTRGRRGKKDKKDKKSSRRRDDDAYSDEEQEVDEKEMREARRRYEEEKEEDARSDELSRSEDDPKGTLAAQSLIDFDMFASQPAAQVPVAQPYAAHQQQPSPFVGSPFAQQQQPQQQAAFASSPFATQPQAAAFTSSPFAAAPQQQQQQQPQAAFTSSPFAVAPQQQPQAAFTSSPFAAAPQQQQQQPVAFTSSPFAAAPLQQPGSPFAAASAAPMQQQQQQQQQFGGSNPYLSQPAGGFAAAAPAPRERVASPFNPELPALPKVAEQGPNLLNGAFDPFAVVNL